MLCNNCNTDVDEDSKFCPNCGHEIESSEEDTTLLELESSEEDTTLLEVEAEKSEKKSLEPDPFEPTTQMIEQISVEAEPEKIQPQVVEVVENDEAADSKHNKVIVTCVAIIAIVVIAVAGLLAYNALKPNGFVLDKSIVSDDVVRTTLSNKFDLDKDGRIDEEELKAAEVLEVDGVTDASWVKEFKYAKSLTLTNSNVSNVDLRDNKELTKIDLSTNEALQMITLPDDPKLIDINLPDREGIDIIFPENSSMELQYVPVKVETPDYTYTQDVESATKVNSFVYYEMLYNLTYDDEGLLSKCERSANGYGSGISRTNLSWSDDGLLTTTTYDSVGATGGRYTGIYSSEGDITELNSQIYSSRTERIVKEGNRTTLEFVSASEYYGGSEATKTWIKDDSGKVSMFIEHVGNGSYYMRHKYTWNGDQLVSETVDTVNSGSSYEYVDLENADALSSYTVSYSYTNGQLTSADYDTGAKQEFSYSGGLLDKVITTSSGSSEPKALPFGVTTITYKSVIGIKGKTPLSFFQLPGVQKGGFVSSSAFHREIDIGKSYYSESGGGLPASFSGKFWWDEEGIVDYQKKMNELKN